MNENVLFLQWKYTPITIPIYFNEHFALSMVFFELYKDV